MKMEIVQSIRNVIDFNREITQDTHRLLYIRNFFYYNFGIFNGAKLWFRPRLNIYSMYIFIYIKLTKVVEIWFIGSAGVFHTGTKPNPATPHLPCTLFNRKLSISSARGNVFWIPQISRSPDLINFNRIRLYAMRSLRCTYKSSIVSFSLKGIIGHNHLPRSRQTHWKFITHRFYFTDSILGFVNCKYILWGKIATDMENFEQIIELFVKTKIFFWKPLSITWNNFWRR